jgi:beta-N-acetylglucosaminidase
MKINKKTRRILHLLVIALLLPTLLLVPVNSSEQFFSGDAKAYYDQLVEDGFPATYAAALTELHLLHPQWSFAPLLITEGNADYTWQYVLEKETEDPSNNLVYASNTYRDYRHPLYTEQYDTGHYPVSKAGLAYFMDPRNFLNEADVFQFLDLSDTAASPDAVKAVLQGTFMEDAQLDNGILYADYIYDLGNELGVNPIYLAVKIRQEMGVRGTSPVISGTCGTLLADYYRNNVQVSDSGTNVLTPSTGYTEAELLELDGYYNYFNISASGNGTFTIYYKAMQAARKGTPSMAAEWGGSPSWDTRWKAIYGGAYVVKDKYVDAYQSTVYLQKFNVDGRSGRNFWGQYMQNVAGALIEARSLYQSIASVGALDAPATFLIPVYRDMPHHASSDPAGGECSYLRSTDQKYGYGIALRNPISAQSDDTPLYRTVTVVKGETVKINGLLSHNYGVRSVEYSLDGGAWVRVDSDAGRFDFEISSAFLQSESHILIIRGIADFDADNAEKKSNSHFLGAVLYLNVNESSA